MAKSESPSTQTESSLPDSTESTQTTNPQLFPSLDGVEEILRYEFKDKALLEEAFTYKSFSFERLEHVGDSVLNLLITKENYFKYPELPPGVLTRLRAANVDTDKLARVAIKHGLYRFLRHNKPLFDEQIEKFTQAIVDHPLHSNGLVRAPKVLADMVESVVGAVFIDTGCSIDVTWKVFKVLLEPIINRETLKIHPVTQLHEVCQKNNLKITFVDAWKERMTFFVLINGELAGRGTNDLKKEIAYNIAAKNALDNIRKIIENKRTADIELSNEISKLNV